VLLTIAVLLPGSALAEPPPPDYARSGFYIGVGGVVGVDTKLENRFEDMLQDALGPGAEAVDGRVDAAFGVNGRIGYRLHPRVAVEGEFEWIDGFDLKISGNEKPGRGETWFASGNVKGFVLTERFQPYVLVGAGYYRAEYELLDTKETDGDAALRAGLGFDGYITEHIVVTFDTQYVLPFGDVDDLDYVSIGVGVQYRF
jgi:opacity protein-like surface antigen